METQIRSLHYELIIRDLIALAEKVNLQSASKTIAISQEISIINIDQCKDLFKIRQESETLKHNNVSCPSPNCLAVLMTTVNNKLKRFPLLNSRS
ncbi:hypothetical protein SLEP1_g7453 [Rubroshorea leprosula]|uniref:Uncharacterized protein n=1 Tax=Rubroshorea leprosula TaxID=152421 RepID=A0AAV5I7H5_9ROSI|nr:hypothetical protein SLEP1_g7453 [Rubroshorea leprosula]